MQKGVSHKNMACVFFCLERNWGIMAQIFRVERTKNFTVMSNHHFKNKNLTLKAKGLLSRWRQPQGQRICKVLG